MPLVGPFVIEPLTTPAPLHSGQPRLAAAGMRAVLSWLEGQGRQVTLKFAERTDAGWTAPRVISAEAGILVNASDVPLVQPVGERLLVAQWVRERAGQHGALDLRVASSADGGRTWSTPVTPHRDGAAVERGFGAVFPFRDRFGVAWLDGRAGGDTGLWAATAGSDGTLTGEVAVDARVCECCQTAAAVTTDGPIVVFRDRNPSEVRDIALTRLGAGGWSTPTPVHNDGWTINGCPINGPAVAASGRDVVVAWFTARDKQPQVLAAFSRDAGRTFGRAVRVDDGAGVGRVQVALLDDGAAAVSWVEGGSHVAVRRVGRDGARGPTARVAEGSGTHYPRMVRRGSELLFAWTEQTRGSSRARAASARLGR